MTAQNMVDEKLAQAEVLRRMIERTSDMPTIRAADLARYFDGHDNEQFAAEASSVGIGVQLPQRFGLDLDDGQSPRPYVADKSEVRDGDLLSVTYQPVNHLLPPVILFND